MFGCLLLLPGNELDIDFSSGLGDANIGIYLGDCSNLIGQFCEASNNGNITASLTPTYPGDTYYHANQWSECY